MPMEGSLVLRMKRDPELSMRGSRVLTCASLRTIEFDQGDGGGTSVLRFDREPLGS